MAEAEPKHTWAKSVVVETTKRRQRPNDNKAPVASDQSHTSLLETALYYAAKGLPVIPLYSANGGACTCGNNDCAAPGRHPRTSDIAATTDPDLIKKAWHQWPTADIGIAMGATAGLVALVLNGYGKSRNPNELPGLEENCRVRSAFGTAKSGFAFIRLMALARFVSVTPQNALGFLAT